MDDMLQFGKQILASQPFSALLGAELTVFAPGRAELTIPITPQLLQQNGFVHGGVLSYAADNALTFAGGTILGTLVLTSESKINYTRPAVGAVLVARAVVVYAGKTHAVCRCEIFAVSEGKESLCAVAQGTIVKVGQAET